MKSSYILILSHSTVGISIILGKIRGGGGGGGGDPRVTPPLCVDPCMYLPSPSLKLLVMVCAYS